MLLDTIQKENDIKQISADKLEALAAEIREFLISKISVSQSSEAYTSSVTARLVRKSRSPSAVFVPSPSPNGSARRSRSTVCNRIGISPTSAMLGEISTMCSPRRTAT